MATDGKFERHIGGGWYHGYIEQTITFADLTTASATEVESLSGFPANAYPLHAYIMIDDYFTGGSATACTAQVGDTGDPNGLLAALNVFDTTTKNNWFQATPGVEDEYGSTGPAFETAYAPEVLFTATTDTVDNLTAGSLTVRVYYKRYQPN